MPYFSVHLLCATWGPGRVLGAVTTKVPVVLASCEVRISVAKDVPLREGLLSSGDQGSHRVGTRMARKHPRNVMVQHPPRSGVPDCDPTRDLSFLNRGMDWRLQARPSCTREVMHTCRGRGAVAATSVTKLVNHSHPRSRRPTQPVLPVSPVCEGGSHPKQLGQLAEA